MRVVFINISDIRGGASIVANRLRVYMTRVYGIDAYYFVADKQLDDERVFVTRNKVGWFLERLLDLIGSKAGLQYQFFPFSSWLLLRAIRRLKPDVIGLHNTHGGFFQTNLIIPLSRIAPIVWTLHDMWAFTGNAAHTFGNDSWKTMDNDSLLTRIHPRIGINAGRWLLRQKKKIYNRSDLTLVTPSQWLLELARQSPVFVGKEFHHIFNGIDLKVFHRGRREEVRSGLGISPETKTIMFSAGALANNIWKGGDHLLAVLRKINDLVKESVHLLIVGSGELNNLTDLSNFVFHRIGYVHSEMEMAGYLSATDVFIYPTKADTLPTVLIEASACGTPSVTFDIGGSKEIVIDGSNGIIIEPFRLDQMAKAIVDLLSDPEKRMVMSLRARAHAEANFSIERMAESYYALFKSVAEKRKMIT